jgi:hypothetical protein
MKRGLNILIGFVILFVATYSNSCTKNIAQPAPLPAGCDTTNLTYTNSMQVLVNINCGSYNSSCHSAGASDRGDFSNYASIQHYVAGGEGSIFWRYIFTEKRMPVAPELPLDPCASNKFRAWLLAGAPQ